MRAEAAERELLDRQEGMTLAKALREYVDKKRRAKDGLPLKARTKADYLVMVEPGETTKKGKKLADGLLFPLADKLLAKLTCDDIWGQYSSLLKRSKRQADYSMQVLRAVMRWHGVVVPVIRWAVTQRGAIGSCSHRRKGTQRQSPQNASALGGG